MCLFPKKIKIAESGIFKGFTDFHCHILPGVDDGFRKMEDSLEALSLYEAAGIRSVWLTPHIMEDMPNTVEDLERRFDELKQAYTGSVELHLAAENMMDNLFIERLATKELLPIFGQRILVETSYYNAPLDMYSLLRKVKSLGYYPLLAHPERYIYMEEKDYKALKEEGVQFQLNFGSIVGAYGDTAKIKAEKLLAEAYYSVVGTDLHSLNQWHALRSGRITKKVFELVESIQ